MKAKTLHQVRFFWLNFHNETFVTNLVTFDNKIYDRTSRNWNLILMEVGSFSKEFFCILNFFHYISRSLSPLTLTKHLNWSLFISHSGQWICMKFIYTIILSNLFWTVLLLFYYFGDNPLTPSWQLHHHHSCKMQTIFDIGKMDQNLAEKQFGNGVFFTLLNLHRPGHPTRIRVAERLKVLNIYHPIWTGAGLKSL